MPSTTRSPYTGHTATCAAHDTLDAGDCDCYDAPLCWCGADATYVVTIDPEVTPWDGETRSNAPGFVGEPVAFRCDDHLGEFGAADPIANYYARSNA